jgi:uncharacterized lipoprotein YddW (UPF0748 family)
VLILWVTVRVRIHASFVSNVWNSDWPSQPGLTVEPQKAELLAIIKQLQALNFNALVLQVRPEGDALYASELEPWSAWMTGTQGKAPIPFYDPLAFAIAECHKRTLGDLATCRFPLRSKDALVSHLPRGLIMLPIL